MSDLTGMARGRLRPIIYFESPSGYCVLAPHEIGHDTSLARRIFQERYRGWEWREAGSWEEWGALEKRLVAQERKNSETIRQQRMASYDVAKMRIRSDMQTRLVSGATSEFEKEFIRLWLQMDDDKRAIYEQRWRERDMYLWAREQDAATKVEDRMKGENSL